jgi:spore coat-associated protein N
MDTKGKRILLTVAGFVAVAGIAGGAVSLAVYTDTETVDATFTSGTIILDATKIDALTLTSTNLVPGDSITGAVDVENDGTSQLRYSLNTTSTSVAGPNGGVLNAALTVEVRTVDVDLVGCGSFDGTVLQASEVLGASNVMFGTPSPTVGTGDRTVNVAATDVLCIKVSLPIATGDTYQGATATTTFTFNAEQTANN